MTAPRPAGLDAGGQELWDRATVAKSMHPGELVVLEEACRIKDRLDLFHQLLTGDANQWMQVLGPDQEGVVSVQISSPVTEARLHAGELRQLVEKLRLPFEVAGAGTVEVVDDVAARRAKRSSRKAGAAGM